MTCRLQEARPRAPCVLAAPMAHIIALTALAALGLSGTPFLHEPFHAERQAWLCQPDLAPLFFGGFQSSRGQLEPS